MTTISRFIKIVPSVTLLLLSLCMLLETVFAQPCPTSTVQVDGRAHIFASGLTSVPNFSGGGGLLPTEIGLQGNVDSVSFSATGQISWDGTHNTPPDGATGWGRSNISTVESAALSRPV